MTKANGKQLFKISRGAQDFSAFMYFTNWKFITFIILEGSCTDTANGATDWYDTGCDYYTNLNDAQRSDECGGYDDGDFKSNEMCCACGGIFYIKYVITLTSSEFNLCSNVEKINLLLINFH